VGKLRLADDWPTAIVQLDYTFTPDYPDAPPTLAVHASPHADNGGSDDEGPHPFLDVAADAPVLLAAAQSAAEENLGLAMGYAVVMAVKERAELLVAERARERREEVEREAERRDREDNARFAGEQVTRERFLAWREGFRAEMKAAAEEERRRAEEEAGGGRKGGVAGRKADEAKLTGRQLWERGLVGVAGEEEDDLGEGVEKLRIQA
jgi:hypothetical protein